MYATRVSSLLSGGLLLLYFFQFIVPTV